jgi:hypothetical protein
MSQNGPYLSQKRPKPTRRRTADWRYPPHRNVRRKGSPMSRLTTKWLVLASLTLAGLTTSACTRNDATGPSDQPSFEGQGSNTAPPRP